MDLTALELGLRNRQLLQVKCFLKIQVETFRYFLSEELPRLKTTEERVSSLDKFFTHDWQNVLNKIVSVAVVNMTGDYGSMMLAVSLFRSVIQSCNQLLLIMSSINQSELDALLGQPRAADDPGRFVLSRSSSSTSSYDSQHQPDSNTIKDKIFFILQKQIRSIKSHLERVYNVNVGTDMCSSLSDFPLHMVQSRDGHSFQPAQLSKKNSLSALSLSDIDQLARDSNGNTITNLFFDKLHSNPQVALKESIEKTTDKIALIQFMCKKYCENGNDGEKLYQWDRIVETVIEIVSHQLRSNEIFDELIDRVCCILSQTGLPSLYLLFSMFIQTCDAKLRQKLLQVFFTRFDDLLALQTAIQMELDSQRSNQNKPFDGVILQQKLDFAKHLQIMSIIDLYTFCYRPKLDESQHLEFSIEWILRADNSQVIESFILPSLEEISIYPELFANWRALNKEIYNNLWHLLRGHFVQKQDFMPMVSAEVLWQYWVDRNKVKDIVEWIENGHTSLPYCANIVVPNELEPCQRMLHYLRTNGSLPLRQKVMQCLCIHQTFFGGHSLYELDANFDFQTMLGHVGQSDHLLKTAFRDEQPDMLACFLAQPTSSPNPHLHLTLLLDYCLENELYEFLYLLFDRFRSQLEPVIARSVQAESPHFRGKKANILQLLCHFNQFPTSQPHSSDEHFIFTMSLLAMQYLYASPDHEGEQIEQTDLLGCIVKQLIEQQQDIDLTLLMLSFSNRFTFDQLAQCIKAASYNNSSLLNIFSKLLNSKYSLIWRAFESNFLHHHQRYQQLSLPMPVSASTPEQRERLDSYQRVNSGAAESQMNLATSSSAIDLYSLLQQAIPYVNIDKFFKWQIKRHSQKSQKQRSNSLQQQQLDDTSDSSDFQSRTRKISTTLNTENLELPNFSQNRLSELYGLKAELTCSYYLKNARLLQAFFKCFNFKASIKSARARDQSINQKLAIKATRKAALIAYGSIRQNSVFACSLLFQSLIRANLNTSTKLESGNHVGHKNKSVSMDESVMSVHSLGSDINGELEKTRLHLSIGKLIIEYAPDCLTVQSAQQQQSSLALLLRKSHFNSDRSSSQKLLDLAVIAIERKHHNANLPASRRTILNNRLHSLLLSPEGKLSLNNVSSENTKQQRGSLNFSLEDCTLLMECFDWKPLLVFADKCELKRPLNFLTKCAQEDNWLVFTIFAQMYTISKDDIQALLRAGVFNNHCIGEHLAKAFQSSSKLTLSDTDSKLVKKPGASRNDFYSRLFKNDPTKASGPRWPQQQQQQLGRSLLENDALSSANSSPETFSLSSNISAITKLSDDGSAPIILYEHTLKPDLVNKDFLQLVLEIYQNCVYFGNHTSYQSSYSFESTFRNTLLYAAVSLSNPILALLACSLDKPPITPVIEIKSPSDGSYSRNHSVDLSNPANSQFKFNCFMCWLLASVNVKSKQLFLDQLIYSSNSQDKKPDLPKCYLSWTSDKSLRLIEVLTQHDSRVFVTLLEGLSIFDLEIPILEKLLQFLIQFFIEKDYYKGDSETLLQEFKTLLQSYNEDEYLLSKGVPPSDYENFETEDDEFVSNQGSLRIFYSKNWIERCCLKLVINSLHLAQQFELGILLSKYNFVRLQESFSPNLRIPDIRNLYLFSQCLAKLPNFTLPIAELLHHGPTLSDNGNSDYTEYVSIFRKLIFDLQEAGHFDEARNIINLISSKANVNEFIINEWMLKAKKANKSTETNYIECSGEDVILDNIDLTFWENCWAQVTKLDPSMHSAFKVMERFVQHLQPNQMLIKCFVLLKCMLAIESILRDFIETNQSENSLEDASGPNSFFDDLATNNLDLVQDYFSFEYALWSAAVECEYLILHKTKFNQQEPDTSVSPVEQRTSSPLYNNNNSGDSSFDDQIVIAWKLIWRDIINYTKSSSFSNYIIPKLSLKHTFFYKNISAKRSKHVITLESHKQQALNQVIGKLLDSLCLQKAKDVAAMFRYNHSDFEIIEACDNAAKGIVQNVSDAPFSVQFKTQNLDSANVSVKFVNYSHFTSQNLSAEQKQTISLIETFTNFATIGKKSCNLIMLYFKISCILKIPYAELMNSNYSSIKVFQLLLSSNQLESSGGDLRNRANSIDASEFNYSMDTRSHLDSTYTEDLDQDFNRSAVDLNTSQSSSPVAQFTEAIGCAKELIKIVGEQDEQLNSEEKIATLLASHTQSNVQQLVEKQFNDSLSLTQNGSAAREVPTHLVTEIELDKNQLEFYSARFLVLLKLLHEPSILGHTLIELCKKQKSNFDSFLERTRDGLNSDGQTEFDYALAKRKHYVLLVELFIRAHECFTAQCDVHGIALVLRRTRLLITQELQEERYFHLILRLLTGIGRYSEMTYCFDLFRECDRFELILSKRVKRTPQLRIALLNYLKTTNKIDELLPLVAIRFFLYRETADYHRARAQRLLSEVCAQQMPNSLSILTQSHSFHKFSGLPPVALSSSYKRSSNSLTECSSHSPTTGAVNALPYPTLNNTNLGSLRAQLETMMYEFQEAEANYTKASSHTNADLCARKAQLVALQIGLINRHLGTTTTPSDSQSHVPLIINMEPSQMREFIIQCNNFFEALIVSKAYTDVNTDWTDPFFHNVILNGNMVYLVDFADTFPISITLLKNLVKRYDQLSSAVKQQNRAISRDLHHLSANPTNSPSSASFNTLLSNVRSDHDLQRARRVLESLLERVLCQQNNSTEHNQSAISHLSMTSCNLKDKYKLAAHFDSSRLMQRLMEADTENSAYLLDLKHIKKL